MSFPPYPTTERQKKIVAMAAELASVFARRAAENDWAGIFPLENYRDLQQSGYLTLTVPRDLGGWDADVLEVTLAQQQLAQGDASTALVVGMHLSHIARMAENLTGPNQLFTQICQAIVQDGALLNNAATEPATGSPSRGGRPTTIARRQNDGSWRITGHKTYTTGSPVLHFFVVRCSIESDADATGLLPPLTAQQGNFLVLRATPGVSIKETWNALAMRTSGSHDLILQDVHVPAEAYIEQQMPPKPAVQERLAAWTFPVIAIYLGIAQAARNAAVQFARQHRPNSLSQPLSSIPHIQEKVAKMDLALLQSRAVLLGTADQFVCNPSSIPGSQFAAVKYLVTNHAVEIVDLAMRLVGGASLSLNSAMQRYYRDVRAGLYYPPADDITMATLSKQAFAESSDQR